MKYIDAERLKQFLNPREWGTPDERWIPEHEIGAMLDYFPAADVVEVRHGRWNWVDGVRCSICNYKLQTTGLPSYCPNCWAKMDEVEE